MTSFAAGAIGLPILVLLTPAFVGLASRAPAILPLSVALLVAHVASTTIGALSVENFDYWRGASMFGLLASLYVYTFGAVYKSVSLNVLLAVARRPDGTTPLTLIVGEVVPRIFDERIALLVKTRWVERSGDVYLVAPDGEAWATLANSTRRLFGVTDAGLYLPHRDS